MKHALTTAPLLSYPDWTQGFTLRTDASYAGLGAVLRQGEKVVAYLSRGLSEAEAKWDVRELECLAVIYACEQLRRLGKIEQGQNESPLGRTPTLLGWSRTPR